MSAMLSRRDMDWMSANRNQMGLPMALQYSGGVMDVLSASMYSQEPKITRDMTTSKQLFGGIVMEEEQVEDVIDTRPKKRQRTQRPRADSNEGSDEATKKQRGRPRVDTQDETAIDRRRTQIRLAQRAYRNRKETTITSLKEKVDEMQQTLDRMNQVFVNLYDNLIGSEGLNMQSQAGQQLQQLRDEFAQAANLDRSTPDPDIDDPAPAPARQKSTRPAGKADQKKTSRVNSLSVPVDRAHSGVDGANLLKSNVSPLPKSSRDTIYLDSPTTYEVSSGGRESTSCPSYFNYTPPSSSVSDSPETSDWPLQSLDVERAFPVRNPYTYSFQETTFARRLHRFCLEQAFHNLNRPNADPAWTAKTFYFALSSMNKSQLRRKFREVLQRKAGESLENWDAPYYHVGGAGTHFAQRDATGKMVFPPNVHSPIQAPGPWDLVDNRQSIPAEAVQKMLDTIGFGGEWFDAREVEEYLKTKGIYLDGHSSYVDLDTSETALTKGSMPLSFTTRGLMTPVSTTPTTLDLDPNTTGLTLSRLNDSFQLADKQMRLEDAGVFGAYEIMEDWSGNSIKANAHYVNVSLSSDGAPTQQSRVITFNVDKFLSAMVGGGACLGRAPGFRRDAVDKALLAALQDPF